MIICNRKSPVFWQEKSGNSTLTLNLFSILCVQPVWFSLTKTKTKIGKNEKITNLLTKTTTKTKKMKTKTKLKLKNSLKTKTKIKK